MPTLIQYLQQKITTDIPITKHMGIKVISFDNHKLKLSASLDKNINHRNTAFGGSITSLATLACWGVTLP